MALLTDQQVVEKAQQLKSLREGERKQLDLVRRYWKGIQRLPEVIPTTAPREVHTMARIARVNICSIVVDALAQSMFVDGFRTTDGDDSETAPSDKIWDIWQANKMDARQGGVHRATFAYGTGYAVVMPGELNGVSMPVIRGVSPRSLCAQYDIDDPDWPVYALEYRGRRQWRLYDDGHVYELTSNNASSQFDFNKYSEHGAGVTPIVRYLDEDDLDTDDDVRADWTAVTINGIDVPTRGQIGPLMSLQDQIDMTTFGLLTAQWYSAFRQRYAIGWVAKDEAEKMKAAASQLWTFEDNPDDLKLGEFEQTNLDGYIKSREASLRHAATLSQTPVHELLGELINISAEALAAAEAGHERKVDERKTTLGESHEQTLRLAGKLAGVTVEEDAEVVWRDTSARTFAATIDGLGKMVKLLGIPPTEVWERIPGVTRQDLERWKAAAGRMSAYGDLLAILEAQVTGAHPPDMGEPPTPGL